MLLPYRVDWKGNFKKDDKLTTRTLGFNCNSEDAAREVIQGLVDAMTGKGWVLVSNEVKISTTHPAEA